jgi:hypothetical protein
MQHSPLARPKHGGEPLKGNAEQTTAKMVAEEALWRSIPTETSNQDKWQQILAAKD